MHTPAHPRSRGASSGGVQRRSERKVRRVGETRCGALDVVSSETVRQDAVPRAGFASPPRGGPSRSEPAGGSSPPRPIAASRGRFAGPPPAQAAPTGSLSRSGRGDEKGARTPGAPVGRGASVRMRWVRTSHLEPRNGASLPTPRAGRRGSACFAVAYPSVCTPFRTQKPRARASPGVPRAPHFWRATRYGKPRAHAPRECGRAPHSGRKPC